MSKKAIRGGMIEVRQEKTGRLLVIPAHQDLLALLADMEARRIASEALSGSRSKSSTLILTSTRGTPWTQDGFRCSWSKTLAGPENADAWPLAAIQEAGLVFHGLRKSSVVTLLEAGCTDAEVASITGQSRQMVEHYARQVNQRKLAASAILKWERLQNEGLQNALQNPSR
jgi:integrase